MPRPRPLANFSRSPAGRQRWPTCVGLARFVVALLATATLVSSAFADQRSAKQREAFVRFLRNRGVDPSPEKLAALLRDLQPNGPKFAQQRAAFERFRDPDFATREAALRSLVAEPWIPPQLVREYANSPDPESRWRTRRVQQLAGAAQEQFFRVANQLLQTAPLNTPPSAPPTTPSTTPQTAPQTAPQTTPLTAPPSAPLTASYARAPLGTHTLIATGTRGVAIELDGDGKEQWRVPFRAWSAERLAGGSTLLASVEEQAVVEIDRDGQVLWRYGPVAATRAKPLANGNVLVVDYPGGRVLELGRDRSVRWQHTVDEPCFDAERLDNGHTLVATANLILEIAFDGGTVWQWQVRGRVNGVQALSDGRILVANYGANEVVELDNEARIVRRIDEPQPSDAFRLPNGNTLVATAARVVEFNPSGELLRVLATARYGSARR